MTREDVRRIFPGAGEAEVSALLDLHSTDIGKARKGRGELEARLAEAEASLSETGAELERLRELDFEGMKKAASDWEQRAREVEEASGEALRRLRLDAAIDAAVSGARAKNGRAVRALLDEGALTVTETGVEGLEAQLAAVRRENGFLFEADFPRGGAGFSGMRPPGELPGEGAGAFMNGLIKARGE